MHSAQHDSGVAHRSPVVASGSGSAPRRPVASRDALQRRYGNRGAGAIIQAKLNVGPVDDPYEREADRISQLAFGSSVQRAPEAIGRVRTPTGGAADPGLARAVDRARGSGGRAVPGGVRERMERVSGADFSGVRVHVGAESDRLNDTLGSRAFTVGADVFVRRSEYRPGSARGDALLGHELTHTVQQGAAGPCTTGPTPTVGPALAQRKFGFELELHHVPLFSRRGGVESTPRKNATAVASGKRFEAHVDHTPDLDSTVVPDALRGAGQPAPILELVTGPMDEFKDSESTVRGVMNRLVQVATHIENQALTPNTNVALDGVPGLTANPAGVNFVGYPNGSTAPAGTLTGAHAHVQATYGLSVTQISDEFADRAAQPTAPGTGQYRLATYKVALGAANTRAGDVVQWIQNNIDDDYSDAALAEARGLFALIIYYLTVGRMNRWTRLNKNHAGIFFYKTRLSTVRNQIVDSYPELEGLFGNDDLVEELLRLTGRDYVQPVFPGMKERLAPGVALDVMCGEWVEGVLAGTGDKVFDTSANGGANAVELVTPRVGRGAARGTGVVVENRRFAQTEGHAYLHTYQPNEWADMAVRVRNSLRDRQGYAQREVSKAGEIFRGLFIS
ncbi:MULTISPECIES: DUF4157 domain-containing protein [unclassified Solwaraspora]|uniref:eCIS core domain-containing protein n=1 Tax=unclassified Solwaraspora TaxID=2627926 RepID=UPI00259BD6B0|nr:DUF4157 domain-containing protein [Solwaraspora sp. WMMA2056]WJK43506.1 DUF4157 domain-containing protein [Solwaraspora sp. WMMA2056]